MPIAPKRASVRSSNKNFALQPAGALSALTTTSARAQSSSNARPSSTIESDSPSGRAATQPRRSQGASKARA
jgi:hypothetical protein